ncbi:MAG: zf-TFIIB domain-containing protein [Bdellovibrionales bacterium]|nr:zf-TFIIB domain-containing protein [Bdellovibrionales bacterium]
MTSDSDSFEERRRAQEEQYFQKQNQKALERLNQRRQNEQRISPINGKPMEQVTLMGVVIDRCTESGGIWLDRGELEQLLDASRKEAPHANHNLFLDFFSTLFQKQS